MSGEVKGVEGWVEDWAGFVRAKSLGSWTDATNPWTGSDKDTPAEYALRLWFHYQSHDGWIGIGFSTVCKMAPYDLDAYNLLKEWALAQDVDALPVAVQAALGRVLGRKPPRKGTGATARRDARLRAIAAYLELQYGLPPTRGDTSTAQSASAILSTLPGMEMVSEKTIVNLLPRPQK